MIPNAIRSEPVSGWKWRLEIAKPGIAMITAEHEAWHRAKTGRKVSPTD
jgi:hypothetical protein